VIFVVTAFNKIDDLERKQVASQEELARKVADSEGQTRASVGVLAEKIGMTRQDLAKRATALQRHEKEIESRLSAQEEQTKQQLGAVNGEVTSVKGDVGKVRDDVTATRSDLENTKSKLEHAIGDLSRASELIATNHDELETLKHRGDRNYYEFTLLKGKDATRLSTVGLQLKKADAKKSKFTLYVMADDKKIEKKDRTVNEPLQFYTGRDHSLFEIVVNTVDKNQVTGYLATPKTAPVPQGLQQRAN
jgi:chromosome segregation ATPase